MLTSLVERLRPSYQVVLYLLHQDLDERTLARLSGIVEVRCIVPDPKCVEALPKHRRFPPEAAYLLLLPELLPPTLDRILYLDADLLVLDDAAKLWEVATDGRVLAAVQDAAIPLCGSPRGVKDHSDWGVSGTAPYFNCGVVLIQLQAWRTRDVTRRALAYLNNVGSRVDFLHQEALNAVLFDDWLALDQRWNLLAGFAGRPYGSSCDCRKPGMVHFAGRFKPWRAPVAGPFYAEYRAFLSRTGQWVAPADPPLRDRLLSLYDLHLRNSLYSCERALWNRRVI